MYFAACIACLFATATAVFDCGRGTDMCLFESTCNMSTGQCDCVNTTTNGGPDCGLVFDNISGENCTDTPCENGGTCMGNDTFSSCYCSEDFTGETCQTPRYQLDCEDDLTAMNISIVPFGNFSGTIYIEGDSDCTLNQEIPGDAYTISLPRTGGDCIGVIDDPLDQRFTRKVVILYNSEQVTGRDEVVTAVCGNDIITTTSNITVGELNQGIKKRNLGLNGLVPIDADLNFDLAVSDGNMADGLSLGDDITVLFSLTDEGKQKYSALRIEICEATNNLPNDDVDYMSATFIHNSCHTNDLVSVTLQTMEANAANDDVSFIFEAFKFRKGQGSELLIRCSIKLCEEPASCAAVSCDGDVDGSESGFGRRRRDADSERALGRVLTIKDPFKTSDEPKLTPTNDVCSVSGEIIGVLVAMAIVIFFLLVVCTVLAIRVLFHKHKMHAEEDAFSQSSSTTRLAAIM